MRSLHFCKHKPNFKLNLCYHSFDKQTVAIHILHRLFGWIIFFMLSINIASNQIIIFELSLPGKLSANWSFLKSSFWIFWFPIFRHYADVTSNIKRWSEITFISLLEFILRRKKLNKRNSNFLKYSVHYVNLYNQIYLGHYIHLAYWKHGGCYALRLILWMKSNTHSVHMHYVE